MLRRIALLASVGVVAVSAFASTPAQAVVCGTANSIAGVIHTFDDDGDLVPDWIYLETNDIPGGQRGENGVFAHPFGIDPCGADGTADSKIY